LGSNESIPLQGSLLQQKVIAKVIAKLDHFDNQERKRKRNVEQEGQFKKKKKRKEETKEEERTNQTKNKK
jgi:hypothetical protein